MTTQVWLIVLAAIFTLTLVQCDYQCICNLDGFTKPVYEKSDSSSFVIGNLGTNQCLKYFYPVDATWNAVFYMQKVAFLISDTNTIQTCLGDYIDIYIIPTTTSPTMTRPTTTSPTTTSPTMTKTTMTRPTMTSPTTTSPNTTKTTMTSPTTTSPTTTSPNTTKTSQTMTSPTTTSPTTTSSTMTSPTTTKTTKTSPTITSPTTTKTTMTCPTMTSPTTTSPTTTKTTMTRPTMTSPTMTSPTTTKTTMTSPTTTSPTTTSPTTTKTTMTRPTMTSPTTTKTTMTSPTTTKTTMTSPTTTKTTTTSSTMTSPTTTKTTTTSQTTTSPSTTKTTTTSQTITSPTTTKTTTTSPTTTKTTATSPTIISRTTTSPTTTSQTTTSPAFFTGNTELCPDRVKNEIYLFDGFLAQLGNYCYELVNVSTSWHNARRHCQVTHKGGELIHILNYEQQNYFVKFLAYHQYSKSIWIGLTDSKLEGFLGEGIWQWTSGAKFSYENFGGDFYTHFDTVHDANDCVLMKQNGQWTDAACRPPLFWNFGHGPLPREEHMFICQYDITDTHNTAIISSHGSESQLIG